MSPQHPSQHHSSVTPALLPTWRVLVGIPLYRCHAALLQVIVDYPSLVHTGGPVACGMPGQGQRIFIFDASTFAPAHLVRKAFPECMNM